MKKVFYYNTPIGEIGIAEERGYISNLLLNKEELINEEYIIEETELLRQASMQLLEYFNKNRKTFSLPLAPKGTDFQMKVWKALCDIPYAKTCSYKDIALIIGNPKAARAVGMANNKIQ